MEREYTLRHPVVSGLFYPDSEQDLHQTVEGYLGKVDDAAVAHAIAEQTGFSDPLDRVPVAIVAPHAGYIFSGAVQAHSYRLLQGRSVDTAVVVGPAHQVSFRGLSVNLDNAFKTPLGNVEVDLEFAKSLTSFDAQISQNEESHLSEHAIEVQLPFIQKTMPGARIVPVLIGDQRWESSVLLKEAVEHRSLPLPHPRGGGRARRRPRERPQKDERGVPVREHQVGQHGSLRVRGNRRRDPSRPRARQGQVRNSLLQGLRRGFRRQEAGRRVPGGGHVLTEAPSEFPRTSVELWIGNARPGLPAGGTGIR
jgi:hypothetical protein